jgi:hypothetical protein
MIMKECRKRGFSRFSITYALKDTQELFHERLETLASGPLAATTKNHEASPSTVEAFQIGVLVDLLHRTTSKVLWWAQLCMVQ